MDSEIVTILLTQFVSGKINGNQLAESLYKEEKKEEQKWAILQNNLKAQQTTIDDYVKFVNKSTIDVQILNNKLSDMTEDRDKWKEKYDSLLKGEMTLLTAIQTARKGKFERLDVHTYGSYATWDPATDTKYQSYLTALSIIGKYKIIEKILMLIKYI